MRVHLAFVAASIAVALGVWAVGSAMVEPAGRGAVAAGVAIALGFQLLVHAVTTVALPGNRMAAYGVGMLARFVLVVAAALALVPAMGVEPAPFLFSLVTVLFAISLLEPVVYAAGTRTNKGR